MHFGQMSVALWKSFDSFVSSSQLQKGWQLWGDVWDAEGPGGLQEPHSGRHGASAGEDEGPSHRYDAVSLFHIHVIVGDVIFILLLHPSPAKNVAADIASQLCDSVAKKLEGKVMGTFTSKKPLTVFHVFTVDQSLS